MKSYATLSDDSSETLVGGHEPSRTKRRTWIIGIFLFLILLAVVVAIVVLSTRKKSFEENLSINNIMAHLSNLESVASSYNNSRAVALGYNASVEYVLRKLNESNLDVFLQHFPVSMWTRGATPTLSQVTPSPRSFVYKTEFEILDYSPSGSVVGRTLVSVGSGCSLTDYPTDWVNGSVALIARGSCTFAIMADIAYQKSASAFIVYNTANSPFTTSVRNTAVPAFSIGFSLGQELASLTPRPTVSLQSYGEVFTYMTSNIIAETIGGRPNRVIVMGTHLDSVPAGPGINDNGSGSATNLEVALLISRLNYKPKNKLRFCWWGAEEIGLLGSYYYVRNLRANFPDEYKNIALNLNFDMIGSPNFQRGIYNASSGKQDFPDVVDGSLLIEQLFIEFFEDRNINYTKTPFNGRSDYGPFIENSIPAGGLATGAEGIKTQQGRIDFGGITNAAYDPCYHQRCDTVWNINVDALSSMARAAANVLQRLADDEELVDKIVLSNNRTLVEEPQNTYSTRSLLEPLLGSYNFKESESM